MRTLPRSPVLSKFLYSAPDSKDHFKADCGGRPVVAASCHLRSATLDPLRSYRGFIVFPDVAVQRNEAKRLPRTAAKPSARGVRLSDGLAT